MRRSIASIAALLALALSIGAQSQRPNAKMTIVLPKPPFCIDYSDISCTVPDRLRCVEQQPCTIQIAVNEGKPPYQWRIVRGTLPRGLALDKSNGTISGKAATAGQGTILIEVTDFSSPTQVARQEITITIASTLAIDWTSRPSLSATNLAGTLQVTNYSDDEVALTVVVVAVNEIGKAFTLGYQHFQLPARKSSRQIPFGMQMPPGRYRVRADAVGEVAPKNIIYRSALEAGPFATP